MGSLFKILESAGVSLALTKVALGDAINATINGILVFAFRDSSGNAIAPTLNADGTLAVSFDSGICKRSMGELLVGTQVDDTEAVVAEITLVLEKEYSCPSIIMSSYRDFTYRVAIVDDASGTPVEIDFYKGVMGGAQINREISLKKDCFSTVGGTGIQKVIVYATPVESGNKKDDIFSQISVQEAL